MLGQFLSSNCSLIRLKWVTNSRPAPIPHRGPSHAKASRPAGESREGAALFGGGLGDPPNPYPLGFPPGSGRTSGVRTGAQPCAPTERELEPPPGRDGRFGGESREGAALFGGGLGDPPNPYPLRFPPGKRADLRSEDGHTPPIRLTDVPILSMRSMAWSYASLEASTRQPG